MNTTDDDVPDDAPPAEEPPPAPPGPALATEVELRDFALSFDMACSACSALSSDSSRSCWTFLYLARLTAAISSWNFEGEFMKYV